MQIRRLPIALLLTLTGLGVLVAAAPPQAPASSPGSQGSPAPMHVDEIRPGMVAVGRTVFEGTRVEEFKVNILGVLENVIGTRRNLILARLEGGPLANTGVIAGMSGSPGLHRRAPHRCRFVRPGRVFQRTHCRDHAHRGNDRFRHAGGRATARRKNPDRPPVDAREPDGGASQGAQLEPALCRRFAGRRTAGRQVPSRGSPAANWAHCCVPSPLRL